jgi:hypothetical protein
MQFQPKCTGTEIDGFGGMNETMYSYRVPKRMVPVNTGTMEELEPEKRISPGKPDVLARIAHEIVPLKAPGNPTGGSTGPPLDGTPATAQNWSAAIVVGDVNTMSSACSKLLI